MDITLLFYYVLLLVIIVFPFAYVQQRLKKGFESHSYQETGHLETKRLMLLDNLRDLRTEMDMQKLTLSEFQDLSSEIVGNLQEVDKEISEQKLSFQKTNPNKNECMECHYIVKIEGAKFCPMCGTQLSV
ncbi:MAG: zinc ribbon domain-containing protein [Leptospiraceae bacterium]|nr:zinc ribbon domain-containing protein [Leptospiraceae bacterium]MCP5493641.1 zinc ribbon domain-containing protein [Leptospiraceae bacterium]